jgi:hypothetical protein
MSASDTQLDGYDHIKRKLGKVQWQTWSTVLRYGPLTRNEVDEYNGRLYPSTHKTNPSWSRRLVELETMGVLRRPHTKMCSLSGQNCDAWEAVNAVPSPLPKGSRKNPTKSELRTAHQWLKAVADFYCQGRGAMPYEVQVVLDWLNRKGQ